MTAQVETLLTITDLARIFNVSRTTIYRWRTEGGKLPPSIGNGTFPRWRRCDVDAFLAQRLGTGDLK